MIAFLAPRIGDLRYHRGKIDRCAELSRRFASNTTLAGNSDLYVLNRGNGTIVRMQQDGTVVAVRRVALSDGHPLGGGRLNGIAVSDDAQKIWVSVSGAIPDYPDQPGVLLELPAFGPGHSAAIDQGTPGSDERAERIANGAKVFAARFTPADGLGPLLYNAQSCLDCHQSPSAGGMGKDGLAIVSRVGRFDGSSFDPLSGRGGPVARAHTIAELGFACDLPHGPPAAANLISLRNAPALYGLGLIDSIPDAVIRAGAVGKGDVRGRVNHVRDLDGKDHVGRFGWKADTATLEAFVGEAFRNELGITNPFAPFDLVASSGCRRGKATALADDGTLVAAVTAYLAALPAPARHARDFEPGGGTLFVAVGCADCHTPALRSAAGDVPLYSDLLLHDLGPLLNDNVIQGGANGADWRTTPLWGLGLRQRFLHDGRAADVRGAILAHGGEGSAAVERFRQLPVEDQATLLQFLSAL
jgi:mono/diheme cytochrome c family protein